jgi:hypothetical protein
MKYILCILFFYPFTYFIFGQTNTSYRAEIAGSLSTNQTPFWTVNHNWGITALEGNHFYVKGGVFHQQKIDGDWSFNAGIDLVGSSSSPYGKTWLQQIYGCLNWKIWRIDIGSKEEYVSFLNPYLSSGDFTNSNNARPYPKIKASIPDFILIPYTKGNMYIKGDCLIGKYLDGEWQENRARPNNMQYTKGVLAHNKSIYFRFGNIETKQKMQFIFGLAHVTQWGGALYKYEPSEGQYKVHKQPQGIDDLFRVAIAKEGSPASSDTDRSYAAGSQWGAYTFKFDYKLTDNNLISIYHNHFFDDGSGMAFENYCDGLWGFEYKTTNKSLLSGAVLEYIYTKQQTGAVHFNITMDDEHRNKLIRKGNGNDNYYNNMDYVQGSSYFGKTMGTPLFLSPEYNTDGSLNFHSSRIIAFHLGLEGYIFSALKYRLLLTSGQTWGRYYYPYTSVKKGFATQVELLYTFRRITDMEARLLIGCDKGEFFNSNTFGSSFSLIKRGVIFSK